MALVFSTEAIIRFSSGATNSVSLKEVWKKFAIIENLTWELQQLKQFESDLQVKGKISLLLKCSNFLQISAKSDEIVSNHDYIYYIGYIIKPIW